MSGAITAIGTSLAFEAVAADIVGATILGSTVAASVVTGAIAGAVGGAAGAAVTGRDIGKGITQGAIFGGIGGGISNVAKGIAPSVSEYAKDTLGVSANTAKEIGTGVSSLATGTATGLIRGQDIGTALKGGALGAASTVASDYLIGDPASKSTTDRVLNASERGLVSAGISKLVGADPSAPSMGGGYTPSSVTTTGQSGVGVGSQALAQALNVGDPSSSLYSKTGGKSQNVWNQASLRNPNQDIGGANG